MESGSSLVSFNFTPVSDTEKFNRKSQDIKKIFISNSFSDNFNTIRIYLTEKSKERVGKLVQLLKIISMKRPNERWNDEYYFMNRLMDTWATDYGKQNVFNLDSETFVALKTFGANLAKLMLRNKQKHRAYFEENQNVENVLNGLLAKLEKDAAGHRKT